MSAEWKRRGTSSSYEYTDNGVHIIIGRVCKEDDEYIAELVIRTAHNRPTFAKIGKADRECDAKEYVLNTINVIRSYQL